MYWKLANAILFGVPVAFVAHGVYELYSFCQPPIIEAGAAPAAASDVVRWDLATASPLDIEVFLTSRKARPPPKTASDDPQAGFLKVAEIHGVQPAGVSSHEDITTELRLPSSFYGNRTIFLFVRAVRPAARPGESPVTLREVLEPLSKPVLHRDLVEPKRWLLWEEAKAASLTVPIASLPKVVEIGFVQEVRQLSRAGLRSKGLADYIKGKEVLLPLYSNSMVSPRDEHEPLLNGSSMAGNAGDSTTMEIRFRNVGLAYFTMQVQLSIMFDEAEQLYGMNSYDIDSFKQMIGGSTPAKILLVYSIALLHLFFDFLAFKSDVQFWRQRASFQGISSVSVAMQLATNMIMVLYILEERKARFLLYLMGARFCFLLWKLHKLTAIQIVSTPPFLRWRDRDELGVDGTGMEELHRDERRCMRYFTVLIVLPIMVALCGYRLVYVKQRSWFSWLVLSLAVCVQVGGFVTMTPQVFMNYRLKSVEHLPWKVLIYQAINTFIDDVFMLCIRMPEVQKYSVFRDDIVFVICCVQRWLYSKRRSGDDDGEPAHSATSGTATDRAKPKAE